MGVQSALAAGNYEDSEYDAFLARLKARFTANIRDGRRLFTTDAEGLFVAYLAEFPEGEERQHHTCSACRHFVERYAGLVTIDEKGLTTPAALNAEDAPENYRPAIAAIERLVRKAKVTGVFLSSDRVLGSPLTGVWRHMSVELPRSMLHARVPQTAGQAMAEKREDFISINRALGEFTLPMIEQALTLLKTDSLYRSEKVIGAAQFLFDLHTAKAAALNTRNVVWRAIATAPAGFCHPRASMVGTLLEDIASGMAFDEVSRRWKSKMHPLQYQRSQAAPDAGTIAHAEKVVAQLGATGSLARRFARLDEVQALWKPRAVETAKPGDGAFGHLKAKGTATVPDMKIPPITMTWLKFQQTVLPDADRIEFHARAAKDNYTTFLTAVNPDAPPILQWDTLEWRNPVSWYVWHGGSSPSQYGLHAGSMVTVSAVSLKPSMWFGEFKHQGEGVVFLLEGAKESRKSGNALFPEILKSEFHSIRSVIEAYSRDADIEGIEDCSAVGIMLHKGHNWGHVFRVTSKGKAIDYRLDRWD